MDNFEFTVTTKKDFKSAVDSVVSETEKAGFRVLYVHDIQETLSKKGFVIGPLKIIEVCNAKNAYAVLQKDIRMGLFLPCKINVYQKDKKTYISGMKPTIMKSIFTKIDLGTILNEVEEIIKIIIDNAK